MKRLLVILLILIVGHSSGFSQGFGLKEMMSFKSHDIEFFHKAVRAKGYTYERNKADERSGFYSYVYLPDIGSNFREIQYDYTGSKVKILFGTTEADEYERLKKDLDLLEFKFIKYVSQTEDGRSVLMMVYSDGYNYAYLYNSYMECEHHELVRFYRLKIK